MKILFIVHKGWYDKKCPPFWPLQAKAIAALSNVFVHVSGLLWPDYNAQRSLADNVQRIMPDADVVYLWRPRGVAEFSGIIEPEGEIKPLKVSSYQDDVAKAVLEANSLNLDLVFYHDLWDARFFKSCTTKSMYLPLAVDTSMFSGAKPQSERDISVLLTGKRDSDVYPFRNRLGKLIQSGVLPGEVRREYTYRYPNLNRVHEEQTNYARQLGDAQVSIVTTCPRVPLTFRKFFESLASGCVLVGDMPAIPPDDVRGCIVEINNDMSNDAIRDVLYRFIDYPEEREKHRLKNLSVALAYSYEEFARKWLEAVKATL